MTMVGTDSLPWILDDLAVAFARRVIIWATEVGDRCGYHGAWLFGMHADGLRGFRSRHFAQEMGRSGSHFDADFYRETSTAVHLQMKQRPGSVTAALVGRLLDGLGTRRRYTPYLTDSD
jgi:hypothetical protein